MDPVTENTQEEQELSADSPGLRELVKRYPGLQAQIDRIVEERLKRERAAFDKRLQDEVQQRTGQLQQRVDELSDPHREETDKAVKKIKAELTRERDTWAEQAKAWEERYKRGQAEQLLLEAAVKRGAYKPRQVVDLLVGKVAWQDGEEGPVPVLKLQDDEGETTGAYEGAEIGKGVAAYLAGNPNLVAAGTGPGAGGRPGVPNLPLTTEALRGLGVDELRKLRPELERMASGLRR